MAIAVASESQLLTRVSTITTPAFELNSEQDLATLGLIQEDRDPSSLFENLSSISPVALYIHLQEQYSTDYFHLLNQEIDLYGQHFKHRPAVKVWLRGHPLHTLSSAELTELSFNIGAKFKMVADGNGEYGAEISAAEASNLNLALLKGLGFTTLLITIDVSSKPDKTDISAILNRVSQYHFRDIQYRLHINPATSMYLSLWLDKLLQTNPDQIQFSGNFFSELADIEQETILEHADSNDYALLGDRVLIPNNHRLLKLQQQSNLQYSPWGFANRQLKDWLGIGIGALGKIDDNFYQNTPNEQRYQSRLQQRELPIHWIGKQTAAHRAIGLLIEQLICCHRFPYPLSGLDAPQEAAIEAIIASAKKSHWLIEDGPYLKLQEPAHHFLRLLCTRLQLLITG